MHSYYWYLAVYVSLIFILKPYKYKFKPKKSDQWRQERQLKASIDAFRKLQKRLKKHGSMRIIVTTHAMIRIHQRVNKLARKKEIKNLIFQILNKIRKSEDSVTVRRVTKHGDGKFRVTFKNVTFVLHLTKKAKDCSLVTCWKT